MNQNYRFDFRCIKGVGTGMLLYENNGEIAKIDIRKSAETWWDLHNRNTIMNILLKRRAKNKFAGDKCFAYTEAYIRLYADGNEILFVKKFPNEWDTNDAHGFRTWWEQINRDFNKLGYWLFDEG
ncbi:MAG: hypothetical protein Q4D94_11950 [Bacillota bacterium]|nr:hypothetical protein [Bacillota bacterium]